jgi:hypothetical protein
LRGLKSDHASRRHQPLPHHTGESCRIAAPSTVGSFPQVVTPAISATLPLRSRVINVNNFEVSGIPVFKNGSGMWTACRKCSELVDAEKWSTLADRAVRKFVKRHVVPNHEVPVLWAQFTEVVKQFAEHRKREV